MSPPVRPVFFCDTFGSFFECTGSGLGSKVTVKKVNRFSFGLRAETGIWGEEYVGETDERHLSARGQTVQLSDEQVN